MIIIGRALQTCFACPSQWDAWTVGGQYLYLRFRWGVGTVDDENGNEIARFSTGDPWDGVIELEDFAQRAGLVISERATFH